ncbi:MAG: ribonuclease PH [Planctomycetales bacterium]|nr:ribonuclease PH [Planctomycetales bacterium]
MTRHDGRLADQLRPISVQRGFTRHAEGSYLYSSGNTIVLCTASIEPRVPPWLEGKGKGWVTAEYNMLPGSTRPRKPRDRGAKIDGRTTEIQRLIGRSLRAIVDLTALGEQMITVDCDVLQADGGTRTASITGAYLALHDAIESLRQQDLLPNADAAPIIDSVAAVSVGLVDGVALLDLDYQEDLVAAVDMNVVMTGKGRFVEVQGTGEEATFSEDELHALLGLARGGIKSLSELQQHELSR